MGLLSGTIFRLSLPESCLRACLQFALLSTVGESRESIESFAAGLSSEAFVS